MGMDFVIDYRGTSYNNINELIYAIYSREAGNFPMFGGDALPQNMDPFNIKIMKVDQFIQTNSCLPVLSQAMFEPSSTTFHEEGLWSEHIFGQIGSPERLVRFGYIDLNTFVIQPVIYKNILKLADFYEDIFSGTQYAIYDKTTNKFVKSNATDKDASTGFSFFLDHLDTIILS